MSASESSTRIAGLGTLLKAGSLAAVFFVLLKQYKKMKAKRQVNLQETRQHYEPESLSAKRSRGYKIEIESEPSGQSGSEISGKPTAGYRIIPISASDQAIEISDENKPAETQSVSSITSTDAAGAYNPSPGNIYSVKGHSAHASTEANEPEAAQVRDDAADRSVPQGHSALQNEADRESNKAKEELAAIDAIGCMAAEGNETAMNLLFRHVQNDNFYVRYEAIRGILLYGKKEDRELLHESLPAGDWYIMDIRQEDMRKVC